MIYIIFSGNEEREIEIFNNINKFDFGNFFGFLNKTRPIIVQN